MIRPMRTRWLVALTSLWVGTTVTAAEPDPAALEFFEKRIRPALAQHCYECHSGDKQVKGGLRLDLRQGWMNGGDSGPAIEPGNPDESLLIEVIRYTGDLQMPPKGKLPENVIRDFEQWVKLGAADPREGEIRSASRSGIDLEAGRQHWSYQLPQRHDMPAVQDREWPRNEVDYFILSRLEDAGLRPAADADRTTLVRRLYFDLIGLPPTPEQIDAFLQDTSANAYERLVDDLLASPHFGERWGRHWLDVARYAESVTLRGLIFKEAWRYRDYVIQTFNEDRPYADFVRQQVAGDLLPSDSLEEAQRNRIATTFLMLGNTNLEEQDKKQLRMDVVDEQLDTLGKAFLAQTIGCARCHDHKFDPISARDYYALAGILRSTRCMEHANVSKWVEQPLPLTSEEEAVYRQHESEIAALEAEIAAMKKGTGKPIIATKELPGIVIDDSEARKVGEWEHSKYSNRYIGSGYLHDQNQGKGQKSLTFLPELPKAGTYEVRLAYTPGGNRSTKVPVTIFSADGEETVFVNQQQTPPVEGRFVSLGKHQFEPTGQGFVLISNEGTTGHVIADAVQFLPVDGEAATTSQNQLAAASADERMEKLKELEAELKERRAKGPQRPMVMGVQEEAPQEIGDTRVHIRGLVHNLGEPVPRGFIQVATYGTPPEIPENESGRRQLGDWLASSNNPLTARVMVNRVWHWLMGSGIVRTTDNFGTVGERPSHPELLDDLAVRFMEENWSVKQLVRRIVLSRTYRQSTVADPKSLATDPENRLFSRRNRRRLEAECIRDAILATSGQLQLDIGGPTFDTTLGADYAFKHKDTRRSVYAPVFRNSLPELFLAFDFADPSIVTGVRNVSTVAPQALFLMNHPFVQEQARHAARRLLAEESLDDRGRIARAYRLTFGRLPSEVETDLALSYVTSPHAEGEKNLSEEETWARFYQVLFAAIDFRYVN